MHSIQNRNTSSSVPSSPPSPWVSTISRSCLRIIEKVILVARSFFQAISTFLFGPKRLNEKEMNQIIEDQIPFDRVNIVEKRPSSLLPTNWNALLSACHTSLYVSHEKLGISLLLGANASQNAPLARDQNLNAVGSAASSCTNRAISFVDSLFEKDNFALLLQLFQEGKEKQITDWIYRIILKGHEDFLSLKETLATFHRSTQFLEKGKSLSYESENARLGLEDLFFASQDKKSDVRKELTPAGNLMSKAYANVQFSSYTSEVASTQSKRCSDYATTQSLSGFIFTSSQSMSYAVVSSKTAQCSVIFDPHRNVLTIVPNTDLKTVLTELGRRERSVQAQKKEDIITQERKEGYDNRYNFLGRGYCEKETFNIADFVEAIVCCPKQGRNLLENSDSN